MDMRKIFVILGIVIFYSCGSTNSNTQLVETNPTIEIKETETQLLCLNLKSNYSTSFFEEQVDSMLFIPLETKEDVLLGTVTHIKIVKDKLLVVDANKSKRIFVFDMQGKFLYTIGGLGEGPGEYMSINQVLVSPEGNVNILDWMKWKYISYDINGNLLFEHSFKKKVPENIIKLNDTLFVGSHAGYNVNNPYHLTWFDVKDNLLNTGMPIKNVHPSPAGNLQYDLNGSVLFYRMLCDTVYKITENQIVPQLRLGLYDPHEVKMFLERTNAVDSKEYMANLYNFKDGEIVNYFNLMEGEDFWLVEYQKGAYVYLSKIDKVTLKSHNYIKTSIRDRKSFVPFVFMGTFGNWICSSLDSPFFTKLDENNKNYFLEKVRTEEMRKMLKDYDIENRNPIICLFQMKRNVEE